MSEPTFADVGLLGKLKQDVGAPIKQFFTGKPVGERFAPDLQQADAIQDPRQRAEALMNVRQQMRTAGFGVEDTSPVLKPRFDRVLFDLRQRPEGEIDALNIERMLGRVGATRPGTVPQMIRLPGQMEGDVQRTQNLQNQAILGGMKVEQFRQLGPAQVQAERALVGQRQAATGAAHAAAGASGARQKLYEAQAAHVDERGNFHVTIKNKDTGEDEVMLFDKSGKPIATLGAAGSKQGMPASPDDPEAIANAIVEGRQPPTIQGLYRYAGPVRAALAKKDYNLTQAQLDFGAMQKHLATLNSQQQERLRQAISFTYDSLDVIEGLYDQWKQLGGAHGFRLLNKGAIAASKQVPGEMGATATALEAQINDLTSELGTVYKGGYTSTDESLKLAAKNLQADYNEEQFRKSLDIIRTNLRIRRNSIVNSQAAGLSAGSHLGAPGTAGGPAQTVPRGTAAGPSGTPGVIDIDQLGR